VFKKVVTIVAMGKEISKHKALVVNVLSSMVADGVNLTISFFMSTLIVEKLGVEA
jgi:hypothetical protein